MRGRETTLYTTEEVQQSLKLSALVDSIFWSLSEDLGPENSGIKPDDLGHIFDPGFTTKGVGVGVGLGLATAYRIIQSIHTNP